MNIEDEILDLVDKNDNVIGEVTRSEVHKDTSLIHREVGVLIVNNKNEVLLQQRAKHKSYPLTWVISAGGHIDKGENPEHAAYRELEEELGFSTDMQFAKKSLDYEPTETHIIYWYVGKYNNEEIKILEEDIEQYKFFSREELETIIFKEGRFDVDKVKGFKNDVSLKAYRFCRDYWDNTYLKPVNG